MPSFVPLLHRQRGFNLVELMIASAIGLAILAAMATLFLSNSNAQAEIERSNRQIENGRYALQLLGADLRSAGFLSEFDPNTLALPAAVVDPCSVDLAVIKTALPLHLQGYDAGADKVDWTCLADADVKAGTDVVVVRRTASCITDAANCEAEDDGGPFFQASLCGDVSELGSPLATNHFALTDSLSTLTLRKHDCKTKSPVRRFLTRIYFVANNDKTGDGVPTLKRADLVTKDGTTKIDIHSEVNGVENLQFEYGIDTDTDGAPDLYAPDPAKANGCADAGCAVANWNSVMTVKINVLARSTEPTKGYKDTKTYDMGMNADGTANTSTATEDQYKRHVFQSLAALPNPAGRRAK